MNQKMARLCVVVEMATLCKAMEHRAQVKLANFSVSQNVSPFARTCSICRGVKICFRKAKKMFLDFVSTADVACPSTPLNSLGLSGPS